MVVIAIFNVLGSNLTIIVSMERLLVVNLDEIASRWQIPVDRIMHFIVECGMPMDDEGRGKWFAEHSDLVLKEKQEAFEAALFPQKFR